MRMRIASENQNREGGGAWPIVQQTHLFVAEGGIQ